MEWVETTGRSVEEAKDAALDQLGVDEQDAEFEIVEEARTGLFGRLRSEARVRARVRPTRPRPKEERRDRRRRRKPNDDRGGLERASGSRPPVLDQGASAAERVEHAEDEEGTEMDRDVGLAEQGDVAREFLAGLLGELAVKGAVEMSEIDEETVELAVRGDDLGFLIGPKGSTLNALQEVTRTVVQRQTGGRNGRIVVDVGGYRKKRRTALERFVRELADQVKETGRSRALEPMSAADRKVVHDTVNEIDGVGTLSEGEEPRRRVVIVPS